MDTAKPLAGLKVIELGTLIAGPFAARICAEFGAEVIKVESPNGGDPLRRAGVLGPCSAELLLRRLVPRVSAVERNGAKLKIASHRDQRAFRPASPPSLPVQQRQKVHVPPQRH